MKGAARAPERRRKEKSARRLSLRLSIAEEGRVGVDLDCDGDEVR